MLYPKFIQPNPIFKLIDLNELGGCHLIRHTNTNQISELIDPETKEVVLNHICSPTVRMDDLSTSLLSYFKPVHSKIEIVNQGKEIFLVDCLPDAKIRRPKSSSEFTVNKNRHYIFIPIDAFSGKEILYEHSSVPFKAICTIQHTPMKWNYWHFSIRWHSNHGFVHEFPDSVKWKKRLCSNARAFIAKFSKVELDSYRKVNHSTFCKSKFSTLYFSFLFHSSRIISEKKFK